MTTEFTQDELNALRATLNTERGARTAKLHTATSKHTQPPPRVTQQSKPRETAQPPVVKKESQFKDLTSVTVSLTSKPKPWKDSEIKSIRIANVKQLDPTEAIAIGTEAITSIRNGKVTSRTIDQLLALAVSIFSPSSVSSTPNYTLIPLPDSIGNRVREADCDLTSQIEMAANELTERIYKVKTRIDKTSAQGGNVEKLQELEAKLSKQLADIKENGTNDTNINIDEDAYAYTYLAAYIMRLAGKTAAVWADKLELAKSRFNTWYGGEPTVLDNIDIDAETAEKIREGMARRPDCIATWVLWAAYNENENPKMDSNDSGMLRYLVTQMYSYTGMHAYASIMQLQIEHNVTFSFLLDELNCPVTRKAVHEIADIIRHHEVTEVHSDRKTYFRYARVWDSGYFVNLQSKNCTVLGYTVAKTRKMLSSNSVTSDPTQAYAFKGMDEKLKTSLNAVADRLYDKIMAHATQDEESGDVWKAMSA
uniref:Nucleoprotein n=1 Tax=Lotus corniculatus virus 1 TaxID=2793731 RepID=A0A8D9PH15_9RHAB|nr:TPA_asm: N [Lotus corniculatus virus 1]